MLTFGSNETVSSIEARLQNVADGSDLDELHLTSNIDNFQLGAEVALIQMLLTWVAFSTSKTIVTQVAKSIDSERALMNLAQKPYAFVALLGATTVRGAGDTDLSLPAAKVVENELTKSGVPFDARRQERSASLLVTHTTLAPATYAPYLDLSIKDERAQRFHVFARNIDHRLRTFYGATSSVPLFEKSSDLPSVLYELFANAEEWGCTNLRNEPVKIPIRGILFRVHKVPSKATGAPDPLSGFTDALFGDPDCKHVLEASVFDSGVGLAQRHLRDAISNDEPIDREIDAVHACLAKHTSSSGSSSRGLGLHHVMDLISSMKGFLRVRTGRLHLYRNFRQDPYFWAAMRQEEKIVRGKFLKAFQFLCGWETSSRESATPKAYVKGAAFTILLPMREAQPRLI